MEEAGSPLTALPTPEWKRPELTSLYALSKYDQEKMCLIFGQAHGLSVSALRFFNVYGTRQALSNPHAGALAIFASRLAHGKSPIIFEDGKQTRDFVHVEDVAQGCYLAMTRPEADGETFDIGSGRPRTVESVARALARVMGRHIEPEIVGEYRAGDIRHCVADISKAADRLGYQPRVDFEDGLRQFSGWLESQQPEDRTETAYRDLRDRGLLLSEQGPNRVKGGPVAYVD